MAIALDNNFMASEDVAGWVVGGWYGRWEG